MRQSRDATSETGLGVAVAPHNDGGEQGQPRQACAHGHRPAAAAAVDHSSSVRAAGWPTTSAKEKHCFSAGMVSSMGADLLARFIHNICHISVPNTWGRPRFLKLLT
ncbi:hypothetical protein CDAR_214341 [Caerostris darwini]|uniref:Uncharacterized protein n=1 Tax=Caerostris darwini TaxID=1538125 RepID=A0AAV4S2A1_9ARAC|nr:hypothetical protein CDAR_214341 [Caerostris darwini]